MGARMPTPLLKVAVLNLAFWFRPKREATSPVVGQGSLPLTAAKAPLGRAGDGFGAAFARLLRWLISFCRRGEKGSGSRTGGGGPPLSTRDRRLGRPDAVPTLFHGSPAGLEGRLLLAEVRDRHGVAVAQGPILGRDDLEILHPAHHVGDALGREEEAEDTVLPLLIQGPQPAGPPLRNLIQLAFGARGLLPEFAQRPLLGPQVRFQRGQLLRLLVQLLLDSFQGGLDSRLLGGGLMGLLPLLRDLLLQPLQALFLLA